jgi:hypothetical protein
VPDSTTDVSAPSELSPSVVSLLADAVSALARLVHR